MSGLILVHAGQADQAWATALAMDLTARGGTAALTPTTVVERSRALQTARSVVVVHSWFRPGPDPLPYESLTCPLFVAQRNATRLHSDDYPGRRAAFALWDDYYQPRRPSLGRRGQGPAEGGFTHLLDGLGLPRRSQRLPPGYVFVSYRAARDADFVQGTLRPGLAEFGYASWDYRSSERVSDQGVAARLDTLVAESGCLVVVATAGWWSPWTAREFRAATRHGIPIFAVRPGDARASRRRLLSALPIHRVGEDLAAAVATTATRTYPLPAALREATT